MITQEFLTLLLESLAATIPGWRPPRRRRPRGKPRHGVHDAGGTASGRREGGRCGSPRDRRAFCCDGWLCPRRQARYRRRHRRPPAQQRPRRRTPRRCGHTAKAPGPTAGSREAITVVRAGRKRRDASVAGAASRRVAGDNSRSARRGDDAANAAGRSTQRDRSLAGATNCFRPRVKRIQRR